MTKIQEINVDICDFRAEVIAHCCNCFNTQGAGVALAIKNKYPELYEEDCKTVKGDKSKLGKISVAKISRNIEKDENPKFGANLYAQYNYGTDSRKVNYEAIFRCLEALRDEMIKLKSWSVAFPHNMASILAGGDFRIIKTMIEVVFENTNISVYICKKDKPWLKEILQDSVEAKKNWPDWAK